MWPSGLLVALLVASSPARADPDTVALAITDAELGEALTTALAPLGLEVVSLELGLEGSPASDERDALRAAAESHGAVAIVWIEPLGSGFLLSAYSARTGETRSCPLADGPPYDVATAVAVAFSIKTLLREAAVIVTPSLVDEPAEDAAAAEVEESRGVKPVEVAAEQPGSDDASAPELATEAAPPAEAVKRRVVGRRDLPSQSVIWLDLGVDRAVATDESGHASQARVGITYWPSRSADRLGVSLAIGRTATVELTSGNLDVEFSALEAILGARMRLPFAHRFALIPEVGVSLRLSRLRGLPAEDGGAAASRRTSSVAEGALALACFLGPRFALALSVRLGVYFWPVQYTWEGEPIVEEPWTRASAGLRAVFAF